MWTDVREATQSVNNWEGDLDASAQYISTQHDGQSATVSTIPLGRSSTIRSIKYREIDRKLPSSCVPSIELREIAVFDSRQPLQSRWTSSLGRRPWAFNSLGTVWPGYHDWTWNYCRHETWMSCITFDISLLSGETLDTRWNIFLFSDVLLRRQCSDKLRWCTMADRGRYLGHELHFAAKHDEWSNIQQISQLAN